MPRQADQPSGGARARSCDLSPGSGGSESRSGRQLRARTFGALIATKGAAKIAAQLAVSTGSDADAR